MKLYRKINILFLLLGAMAFSSCDGDEDSQLEQISIAITGKYGSSIKAGEGDLVKIAFSKPLLENSSVLIGYRSSLAEYGKNFTTSPQSFREGEFRVNAKAGETEAAFSFETFIDITLEDGFDIEFFIKGYSGSLFSIASTSVYRVEVSPAPTAISQLRGNYEGVDISIDEKTIIEGVVVSTLDGNTNENNIAIQDETGAIIVRFTSIHPFKQGDLIEVSVRGGIITDFRDLVQIDGINLDAATLLDSMRTPEAKIVSVDDLNTDIFQSQYIEIQNVSFVDADGSATFVGGTNYILTDGTSQVAIRVNSADASFVGDVIPSGQGTVRGVAGIFRGVVQIFPQNAADIIF
ncbi:MAG: hypothetical protein ACI85I_001334 [Arenicella sp.]|jgi:hypothetical protein